MNKRVEKLRQESLDTQPYISIERANLVTEAYQKYAGKVSSPVLRALTFKQVLENKVISIAEGELIMGERGEAPKATPTFPELCCHSMEDFNLINDREKIAFKVSEESFFKFSKMISLDIQVYFLCLLLSINLRSYKNKSTLGLILSKISQEIYP